ncbi:MAG TPA: hypothetical protein VF083_02905 [Acidimicrobiia bacterium]|jgi:hypothetical protein
MVGAGGQVIADREGPGLDMARGDADNPAQMTTSPSSIAGAKSRRFFGFVYFGA